MNFTTAVKEEALRSIKAGERRVDIAKRLGCSVNAIYNWEYRNRKKKNKKQTKTVVPNETAELKAQVEVLKKTLAILLK